MPYLLVRPGTKLDWAHDWSDWLAEGDSIASRVWTIDPSATLDDETTAAVTVSGLTAGKVYVLTEAVTTAAGMIGKASITFRCD